MREQLLRWLVTKCKLTLELRAATVEHCIRVFDLYVSKRDGFMLTLDEAQLHLLTCLFISCKYQEIYPPSVTDFEYVSKYKFFAKDFIGLESAILRQIDYRLNLPLTSDWFFALTGKNLPNWVLVCVPAMPPGCSLRKVAEEVIGIKSDEDGSAFSEEKATSRLLKIINRKL
jgi:hypothetical protein